jgi:heterotetrameric sarcosine oxidase gamma subunit
MPKESDTVVESPKNISAIRSPFAGHTPGTQTDKAGNVAVHICAGTLQSVTLISTWCSGLPQLMWAMTDLFDSVPVHTGSTAAGPLGLLARTGPEEFLLIGSSQYDATAKLRSVVGADIGSVTDLSHARCYIDIDGNQSRNMLNKLFAIDLREASFPVGHVRLTGTHHVPCMLYRVEGDSFRMFVFSTYAYDQLATVMDASREYGVSLRTVA